MCEFHVNLKRSALLQPAAVPKAAQIKPWGATWARAGNEDGSKSGSLVNNSWLIDWGDPHWDGHNHWQDTRNWWKWKSLQSATHWDWVEDVDRLTPRYAVVVLYTYWLARSSPPVHHPLQDTHLIQFVRRGALAKHKGMRFARCFAFLSRTHHHQHVLVVGWRTDL